MKKRKAQAVIYYCAEDNIKHFLLLKMNERRNNYWQNITGFVEDDEDFIAGATREAIEETGLATNNIKTITNLNMNFEFHDRWGNDVIEEVFAIETKSKWKVELDPSEHQEYIWIEEADIERGVVHFESNYSALIKTMESN